MKPKTKNKRENKSTGKIVQNKDHKNRKLANF